jgi:HD-like signal output (HDOD) protein
MLSAHTRFLDDGHNGALVHDLLEERLRAGTLDLPLLPEIAIRVMRLASGERTSAGQLAAIIQADPALTMYVLRVAASAAKRPSGALVSLHHAVTWLGFDEVANIAFTLALQGKMLNVPGQNHKARGFWRHALASALWARELATRLGRDAGASYLCGLLHTIGKPATLGAAHDLARGAAVGLSGDALDLLVETFYRQVGAELLRAWGLPDIVAATAMHWEAYEFAGALRLDCNLVQLAHRLAGHTLGDSLAQARELLPETQVFADLQFDPAATAALFDAAGAVHADLDAYLPP